MNVYGTRRDQPSGIRGPAPGALGVAPGKTFNDRAARALHAKVGDVLDAQLDAIVPADRPAADDAIAEVLGNGGDVDVEYGNREPGRGVRRIRANLRALTAEDGTVTGAIICVTDVTEDVRHVATRLRLTVPAGGVAGRIGGDEFVVICRDVAGPAQAERIGADLLGGLRATVVDPAGNVLTPQASVGVAWSPCGAAGPEELIARADAAMYEAKKTRTGPHNLVLAR